MASRQRSERRQRTELVGVRLLPSELERLDAAAAVLDIRVSTLLREAGLAKASEVSGG